MSNIPMSTTWVFLGLLAGREFAIAWLTQIRSTKDVAKIVAGDAGKAGIGLVISVVLAFSAPYLKSAFEPSKEVVELKVPELPHMTQLVGVNNAIKNP